MENTAKILVTALVVVLIFLPSAYGESSDQWYTGSLLSPSGALFHKGSVAIEPYFSAALSGDNFDASGEKRRASTYSRHMVNNTLYKYALTDTLSVQALPEIALWQSEGMRRHSAPEIGDLPVDAVVRFLDIQWGRLHPAFNLFVGVGFPTGRYDNLRASSVATGGGAYVGRFALTEQSSYHLGAGHELRIRLWVNARQPLGRIRVHGMSTYGSRSGRVTLGMTTEAGAAVELAITHRFVFALDVDHDFSASSLFRTDGGGESDPVRRLSSSTSWNVAPALEYNWSARFGLIAGVSMVVSGRNTAASTVPQFAFNAFF